MRKKILLEIEVDDEYPLSCGVGCPMLADLKERDGRDACPMAVYYDGFHRSELCLKGEEDWACAKQNKESTE